MKYRKIASILSILFFYTMASYLAPKALTQQSPGGPSLMENLGRGVVAVRSTTTVVFVSWRLLGTDPSDTSFNLYRSTGGGDAVLLNATPIVNTTYFADQKADITKANRYFV